MAGGGDPFMELQPDDFTYFQVQRRRIADAHNLGVANNAYQQDVLGRGRDRDLADLKHQYSRTLRNLPGQFARTGTLNSGLRERKQDDFNTEYSRRQQQVQSAWGDQQGALAGTKFGLDITNWGAQNDLNASEQARRTTANGLRAGV